ncbi:Dihydrofolate reductase [Trachipleistophora hominis]|uniref:Dihydrofolate reductase n=1 Tax=Trachipleistophora hominis TaxID=72359 RepID=L7JWG0_TRAHO|nr:Dihydrofolate reductase [Trachipleistophora hominis]
MDRTPLLSKNDLNVLVCYTKTKRIIGYQGTIPWMGRLKSDMKFVSKLTTTGNVALVMGRKTYESIGRPLPKRVNIVLSTTMEDQNGIVVKKSFDEAINFCREKEYVTVVFGGEEVYRVALKRRCRIWATVIDDMDFCGDTFFPEVDCKYECVNEDVMPIIGECEGVEYNGQEFIENGIKYSFYTGYN